MVLKFDQPDPDRAEKEEEVEALPEPELRALYERTRMAAQKARVAQDMEELYRLVRGTKTIQRIAGNRGILIRAKRQAPARQNS
ncbi:MAG: hypothetical protein COA62_06830 [Rhodobiaceae bacterium]|nr:MAG: hypothetical protein COA62_06830 [Rhodobiaceae bacterium]